MTHTLPAQTRKLLEELSALIPEGADVYRAAFTILAYNKGWSNARIGQFLGITRHRVGQKIEQYEGYADKLSHRMPTVAKLMNGGRPECKGQPQRAVVTFKRDDWKREQFSIETLALISKRR